MGLPDSNTNRKQTIKTDHNAKSNSIKYESSDYATSVFTAPTEDRQVTSAGYELI